MDGKDEYTGYELVVKFYKRYIEPFIAIFVIVLLIMGVSGLRDYKSLQEEIKDNCGWVEEDYKCYCRKNEVEEIEASFMPGTNNMKFNYLENGTPVRKEFNFDNSSLEE